ncbi:hypothetical protein EK21DRAFT_91414 [Setomelanomma holmii]|uniref:SET domain-containing protein n=1 Tax=Setomelanomma holmii TaxID=210430 RepID=A0A9P4H4Y6_9PLEO|nr:hypothetical protein EK21DRAFT_91414 [Setomelanomma holmii]
MQSHGSSPILLSSFGMPLDFIEMRNKSSRPYVMIRRDCSRQTERKALYDCHCHWELAEFWQEVLISYPGDDISQKAASVSQLIRLKREAAGQFGGTYAARRDRIRDCGVITINCPWMVEQHLTRSETLVDLVNMELKPVHEGRACNFGHSTLATRDDMLGMFAAREIRAGESILVNRTATGACGDRDNEACDNCFGPVDASADNHPLDHPLIARLQPLADRSHLDVFTSNESTKTPIKILQQLRVDVFANQNFDTMTLHTIWTRIANNKAGSADPQRGSIDEILPHLPLFNHSCGPNVEWGTDDSSTTISFFAKKNIAAGEELFSSYLDVRGMSHERRTEALWPWFEEACLSSICKREITDSHQQYIPRRSDGISDSQAGVIRL